jgi:hypothetical protein
MTAQEVFDKVYTHLLTQNKRSETEGNCRYRHGSLKCAAGILIPDSLYDAYSMEGMLWDSIYSDPVLQHTLMLDEDACDMVAELQIIHDSIPVEQWGYQLRRLAIEYDMTIPVIPWTIGESK